MHYTLSGSVYFTVIRQMIHQFTCIIIYTVILLIGIVHHIMYVFIIVFATLVFVIGGGRLVYLTIILDQRSSALGVPLGVVYAVIPISGLIIIAYSINDILQNRLKLT